MIMRQYRDGRFLREQILQDCKGCCVRASNPILIMGLYRKLLSLSLCGHFLSNAWLCRLFRDRSWWTGCNALAPIWLGLVRNHASHFRLCINARSRMLLDAWLRLLPWIQLGQYLETSRIWWDANKEQVEFRTPTRIQPPSNARAGNWRYSSHHFTKND
jgi:hypothetical protein